MRIVIIPGNGLVGEISTKHWYGFAQKEISKIPGVKECVLRNMPDPVMARESMWIPFMKKELLCGYDTIIIGHSSGAEAAMRFAEEKRVLGLILVSAYVTDLNKWKEALAGYYNRRWDWPSIKSNCGFITQFGSEDDQAVPYFEQQMVQRYLGTEMNKFQDRGHFCQSTFPELIDVVKAKVARLQQRSLSP